MTSLAPFLALLAAVGLAAATVTGVALVVAERRRVAAVGRVNAALGVSARTLAECAEAIEEYAERTARLAEKYRAAVGWTAARPAGEPSSERAALVAALRIAIDETGRRAAACAREPGSEGCVGAFGLGEPLERAGRGASACGGDGARFRDELVAGTFDAVLVLPGVLRAYAPPGGTWARVGEYAGLAACLVRLLAAGDGLEIEVVEPLGSVPVGDPRAVAEDPRGLHRIARIDAVVAKTALTLPTDRMLVVDCPRPGVAADGVPLRPARLAVHNHAIWNG